jgi:hypothetical protein
MSFQLLFYIDILARKERKPPHDVSSLVIFFLSMPLRPSAGTLKGLPPAIIAM